MRTCSGRSRQISATSWWTLSMGTFKISTCTTSIESVMDLALLRLMAETGSRSLMIRAKSRHIKSLQPLLSILHGYTKEYSTTKNMNQDFRACLLALSENQLFTTWTKTMSNKHSISDTNLLLGPCAQTSTTPSSKRDLSGFTKTYQASTKCCTTQVIPMVLYPQ